MRTITHKLRKVFDFLVPVLIPLPDDAPFQNPGRNATGASECGLLGAAEGLRSIFWGAASVGYESCGVQDTVARGSTCEYPERQGEGKGVSGKASAFGYCEIEGGRKMNIDHYTYRLTWSVEDREHVGLCAEFPSLSWLAPTQTEALSGIRQVVAEVVSDLQASGEGVPEPLAEKRYSGEFKSAISARTAPGRWQCKRPSKVSASTVLQAPSSLDSYPSVLAIRLCSRPGIQTPHLRADRIGRGVQDLRGCLSRVKNSHIANSQSVSI